MSQKKVSWRRSSAAAGLALSGALTSALGCQSIADIPDVTYSPLCHDYCELEFKACPALVAQYADKQSCLETCVAIDASANGSRLTTGNTISCRMKYLDQVAKVQASGSDLEQACSRGGPGGGDTCTMADAPNCEGYCAIYRTACKGDSTNPFVSLGLSNDSAGTQSECIAKCQGILPIPELGYYAADSGKNSGDTLGCRLYYATLAASDPTAYCDFAGIRPSAACQDDTSKPSCSNFCLALDTACKGDLAVFESRDQCQKVCAATAPGVKDSIETEDTVACRTAHAFNALLVKASDHCPHTGPLGANVCGAGGNCEALCALTKVTCGTQYKNKFPNPGDCEAECSTLGGAKDGGYSVEEGKKGGATVQCRALAVSRILANVDSPRDDKTCEPLFGGAPCSD